MADELEVTTIIPTSHHSSHSTLSRHSSHSHHSARSLHSNGGQEVILRALSAPAQTTLQTTPQEQVGGPPATPRTPRLENRARFFEDMRPGTDPNAQAHSPFLPALGSEHVTHRTTDEQERRRTANLDALRNMTPDLRQSETRIQSVFSQRPQSTPTNRPSSASQVRHPRMSVNIPQLPQIPEVSESSRSIQQGFDTSVIGHSGTIQPRHPGQQSFNAQPAVGQSQQYPDQRYYPYGPPQPTAPGQPDPGSFTNQPSYPQIQQPQQYQQFSQSYPSQGSTQQYAQSGPSQDQVQLFSQSYPYQGQTQPSDFRPTTSMPTSSSQTLPGYRTYDTSQHPPGFVPYDKLPADQRYYPDRKSITPFAPQPGYAPRPMPQAPIEDQHHPPTTTAHIRPVSSHHSDLGDIQLLQPSPQRSLHAVTSTLPMSENELRSSSRARPATQPTAAQQPSSRRDNTVTYSQSYPAEQQHQSHHTNTPFHDNHQSRPQSAYYDGRPTFAQTGGPPNGPPGGPPDGSPDGGPPRGPVPFFPHPRPVPPPPPPQQEQQYAQPIYVTAPTPPRRPRAPRYSPPEPLGTPKGRDGREAVRRFITSLLQIFFVDPEAFPDDRTQVAYAATNLREGPLTWWGGIISQEPENPMLSNWALFVQELNQCFGDPQLQASAQDKVLNAYMRDDQTIQPYNTIFDSYSWDSGFNDTALAAQYYKGLAPRIKNHLAIVGRPLQYRLLRDSAIAADLRYWQREYEKRQENRFYSRRTNPTTPSSSTPTQRPADKPTTDNRNNTAERARRMRENLCLRCGKPGHVAKDCPTKVAMGRMTIQVGPEPDDTYVDEDISTAIIDDDGDDDLSPDPTPDDPENS